MRIENPFFMCAEIAGYVMGITKGFPLVFFLLITFIFSCILQDRYPLREGRYQWADLGTEGMCSEGTVCKN